MISVVTSSPQQRLTDDEVYPCPPEASSVMLEEIMHTLNIQKKTKKIVVVKVSAADGAYRLGQTQRCVMICATRPRVSGCG